MRKIVYMEWVKLKAGATFELGTSAVPRVAIEELPGARDVVDLSDFNLYGYRPLVAEVARRYSVNPNQVITTQGTSMANYLAFGVLVGAGDEVLIEKPAYEPLLSVAKLLGAGIRRFARPYRDGFQIDMVDLESKLTRKTKLIVVTNLHNPSGVLVSDDVLREIGRMAKRVGAHVLVDEVYLDLMFDRRPPTAVHLGDNFIVTSSLTKSYGFDGLRCGWVLANPKLTEEMWRLQDFFGVNGAIPAEKISTLAFQNLDRFAARSRRMLDTNRPLVDAFMARHTEQLAWVAPDGGPVCFPRLKIGKDGSEFAERLYRDHSTRVIPGRFFEMERHFRLGFGCDTEVLHGGLDQISQALNKMAQ
ncbi:MAG TPA: aminotransferase class I/II-fold pyridoxal phosphate-dependent enzyme [Bryobacteraceae bacterium]|nr:aminotransferase class I/II-fold pyridoxal phosphate-dependent enzyme [Bryobacteraceae bacterium]